MTKTIKEKPENKEILTPTKTNKTWEAIQRHKGLWTFTNPKWVTLLNELKASPK